MAELTAAAAAAAAAVAAVAVVVVTAVAAISSGGGGGRQILGNILSALKLSPIASAQRNTVNSCKPFHNSMWNESFTDERQSHYLNGSTTQGL